MNGYRKSDDREFMAFKPAIMDGILAIDPAIA
jgi:hypothetical protein